MIVSPPPPLRPHTSPCPPPIDTTAQLHSASLPTTTVDEAGRTRTQQHHSASVSGVPDRQLSVLTNSQCSAVLWVPGGVNRARLPQRSDTVPPLSETLTSVHQHTSTSARGSQQTSQHRCGKPLLYSLQVSAFSGPSRLSCLASQGESFARI